MDKICKHFEITGDGEWCKTKGRTCLECLDNKSPEYREICEDREE